MGTKTLAVIAFAMALGTAGCRNQRGGEPAEGTPAGGAEDTTLGETQEQAGSEQMSSYTVESIEGDNVNLRAQPMPGEVESQAGRELQISKEEFQRLAGVEAKEGMQVQVQLGADGTPQKIQHQPGTTPDSGVEPDMQPGTGPQ